MVFPPQPALVKAVSRPLELPQKFQLVLSVGYQLQKIFGLHTDAAAEQRFAEQPGGFQQVHGVKHIIPGETVDDHLGSSGFQGTVVVDMGADGGDPEAVWELDDQIISLKSDILRPAIVERDGIPGIGFRVVPHGLSPFRGGVCLDCSTEKRENP